MESRVHEVTAKWSTITIHELYDIHADNHEEGEEDETNEVDEDENCSKVSQQIHPTVCLQVSDPSPMLSLALSWMLLFI